MNRRSILLACAWAAVLLLAGAIRLHGVTSLGLQHWDEGAYTAGPLGVGPYARDERVPFYAPFLYPSLVKLAFTCCAPSDTAAILCAAIPGLFSIAALGWLAARLFGHTVALIAALFLATCEYHIAYCRMALTDAPFLCFFLVSLALYHRSLAQPRSLLPLAAGYVAGLALFTKYHGGLACATAGLYLLVSAGHGWLAGAADRRARAARLLWITAISGAAFLQALLALAWFIQRTVGFPAFMENRTQWANGWHLWTIAATARYLVRAFGEWTSPALWILGALGAWRLVRRPSGAGGYLACWVLLFLAALPAYKNYPRLFLPLVPALCVLAAVGLAALGERLPERARTPALAAAAVLVAALGLFGARDLLAAANTGYRRAGEFLAQHSRPQDATIAIAQHNLFFYLRDAPGEFYSHKELPRTLERFAGGAYQWLVVDLRLQHAAKLGYQEVLERERPHLELAARFPNELNEFVIVNHGGFELLDRLRARPDSAESELVRTIEIYRRTP